jgi:predicted nucleotidyltransferase
MRVAGFWILILFSESDDKFLNNCLFIYQMEKSPQDRIMHQVFMFPTTRLSFRELERRTGLSIGSVAKHAKLLEKEGLIEIEEMPNAKYVFAHMEHPEYLRMKTLSNIENLYSSGLVRHLNDKISPDAIILFGSYGKGSDTERSDVDICVINPNSSVPDLKDFEKRLQRDINVLVPERPEKVFISTIANGFVLSGHLDIWNLQNISGSGKLSGQRRMRS